VGGTQRVGNRVLSILQAKGCELPGSNGTGAGLHTRLLQVLKSVGFAKEYCTSNACSRVDTVSKTQVMRRLCVLRDKHRQFPHHLALRIAFRVTSAPSSPVLHDVSIHVYVKAVRSAYGPLSAGGNFSKLSLHAVVNEIPTDLFMQKTVYQWKKVIRPCNGWTAWLSCEGPFA